MSTRLGNILSFCEIRFEHVIDAVFVGVETGFATKGLVAKAVVHRNKLDLWRPASFAAWFRNMVMANTRRTSSKVGSCCSSEQNKKKPHFYFLF